MKKLLRKTYSVIFIQGFSQASTLGGRLLLTRLLSVSDFGILSIVLMFANFGSQIMVFGSGKLLTKEISTHLGRDESHLKIRISLWSLSLVIALSLILGLISFLGSSYFSHFLSIPINYLYLIIPLGFAIAIYDWHSSIFNGFGKVAEGRVLQFLFVPILVLGFLTYCYVSTIGGLKIILKAHVIVYLIGATLGLFFSLKILKANRVIPVWNSIDIKKWFGFSSQNFISLFLQQVLSRLDLIFISFFLSTREYGLYTVAAGIFLTLSFINYAFSLNLEPKISSFHASGQIVKLHPFLKRNILVQTILIVLTYAGIILLGEWGLGLFGQEYTNMNTVLNILCLTLFSQSLTGPTSVLLVMTDHLKERIWATLIAVFVGCILYPLLITDYGLVGVAWVHFFTNLICRIMLVYYVSKKLKITFWFSSFRP